MNADENQEIWILFSALEVRGEELRKSRFAVSIMISFSVFIRVHPRPIIFMEDT